jgi:hypothetical protein
MDTQQDESDHESRRAADVPETGDPTIDAVLAELASVREQPLEEHIAAGERAHRVLQGRLSDLGGE